MTLEKVLRGAVLTGVFALPFIVLIVAQSMFFPFITGKNFAFRIIVELMAGAWIGLALVNPAYRPKRTWLFYAFSAFVAIIAVADSLGAYPFKSFWSNFERMEGWVTLAHLFVYFVISSAMLNTERLWRYWWHTSLGVSVLVALYGVLQFSGLRDISQSATRLDATLGNATYLAVYMLFHVFIAAFFFARSWVERGAGKRVGISVLYGSIIALNTFVLFFTATRGAILGLIGGAAVASILLLLDAPRSRVAWRAGALVGTFVVLVGGFFLVKDQAWVQNIEPLQRLASISISDGTTKARFMNWQMALEGAKQRPILGWGQENYAIVFDNNYNPNMWGQEPWFDRVHNIFLDWLVAGGVLGLIGYLLLYALSLLMVWRSGEFQGYERAILTGLFAAYFFHNLFVFDNLISYLMFASLLAYITVRATANVSLSNKSWTMAPSVLPVVAVLGILGSFGLVWVVNADGMRANWTLIQAIQPQPGGAAENLRLFKEALSYNSIGTQEIREQLSQASISIVGTEGIPAEVKQQFVDAAREEMSKQSGQVPGSARFPFFLGILLDHSGMYADAKTWLDKAHQNSPRKQSIMFEQGLNAIARGQEMEALDIFKRAYEYAPEYREARIYYASAAIRVDQYDVADEVIQPLMEIGNAADRRLASAYAAKGRFDKIIAIWNAHLEKTPTDTDARFLLAGAYYNSGDAQNSIRTLEEIKQRNPEASAQADALIQQVRGGAR